MKHNRSIQKSWDKLESFFKVKLPRSTSSKPKSFITNNSFSRCASQSRKRFTSSSMSTMTIQGVSQKKLESLYQAKCKDLQIIPKPDHKNKFILYCTTHFSGKTLTLVDYKLGPNSGKILGDILRTNKIYAYVKLGKNYFGDDGIASIIKGLSFNSTIVHLDLSNNNISPEGCYMILRTLKRHPSLSSLNLASESALNRNRLGKLCAVELERFLVENEIIGVFNIYSTTISEHIQELSNGLTASKSLVSLNIGANQLGPFELEILSSIIPKTKLLILNLSDNLIGNEGSQSISSILTDDSILEQLYISGNNISQKGVKSIITALYSNYCLKKLDISNNPIKNLYEDNSYALESNNCLKDLNLSDCSLNYQAILILCQILLKNKGIETLNLSGNSLEDKGIIPIARVLSKNFIIKSLNLSRNKIKNPGVKTLSEVLMNNQGIVEIILRENEIKDMGADDLSEAVRVNLRILRVGLELNMIAEKHMQKVAKYLKINNDTQAKIQPNMVRQQITRYNINKTSLNEIQTKSEKTAKVKEDLMTRVVKQNERYEEILQKENEKFSKLHDQYTQCKNKNFELSRQLENIEIEKIKIINSHNLELGILHIKLRSLNQSLLDCLGKRDELKNRVLRNSEVKTSSIGTVEELMRMDEQKNIRMREDLLGLKQKLEDAQKSLMRAKSAKK